MGKDKMQVMLLRKGLFCKREMSENEACKQVLSDLADGVLIVNAEGRVTFWNLAMASVVGIRRETEAGTLLESAVSNRAFVNRIYGLIQKHEQSVFPMHVELSAGGGPVLHYTVYRTEPQGVSPQFLVFCHRQGLPVSRRAVSEIIESLAHQIRAPLAAMEGWLHALSTGEAFGSAEDIIDRLKRLKQRAHLLLALVDDSLYLNRIQNESVHEMETACPVVAVIEELLDTFAIQCRDKGIEAQLEFSDEASLFQMARGNAERIFTVLIDNAVKYNREKGRIDIHGAVQDGQVMIQIRDTGMGVAPEAQKQIFKPYFRSDRVKQRQIRGSGLGLSIVKTLVEENGGQIEIDSRIDAGTCVILKFPYSR